MKKKILSVFTCLLIIAVLAIPVFTVYATKPEDITATRIRTSNGNPPESRMAGESGNRFTIISGVTFDWSGGIEGTSTQDAIRFYPKVDLSVPPPQRLPVRVHSVCTFESATVMGESGGLIIKLQFVIDEDTNFKGTWVIISGTGGLANIHGQGTVSGLRGEEVFYGKVHFDP